MLMQMALMLAFASIAFEAFMVWNIPALHKFYTSGKVGRIANGLVSIGLSFGLGAAFGASGLIAMTAAMVSTLVSISGLYDGLAYAMDHQDQIRDVKEQVMETGRKGEIATRDLITILYGFVLVITLPVRMIYKLSHWYANREPLIKVST